jgi:glutathione synthase
MKIAFVCDPLERLDPTGDTSLALIEAAGQLGHESFVVRTHELSIVAGRARAPLRRIRLANAPMDGVRWLAPQTWHALGDSPVEPIALDEVDAVFLRTDPPIGPTYLWATWILDAVDPVRTTLINNPRGVRDANEKLFALRFPDLVPPTIVSSDMSEIRRFVDTVGLAVMKPIDGHAGRGVLQLRAGDANLRSILELGTARGSHPTVVQAWVDDAAIGNRRILLWNGEVLGAVNRPVEPDDFRTGSPAESVTLTSREREIVSTLRPELHARGLIFVGLDTIGDFLIEVNITSPGGIRQAMGLGMPDIARDLIEALERDRQPSAQACLRAGQQPSARPCQPASIDAGSAQQGERHVSDPSSRSSHDCHGPSRRHGCPCRWHDCAMGGSRQGDHLRHRHVRESRRRRLHLRRGARRDTRG